MSNQKNERRKTSLKSTLILLILTLILLISATYAWFTSNQTVTVSTLQVNVAAQNGLQISANADDWKSIITNNDLLAANGKGSLNQLPDNTLANNTSAVIEPCSTDGTVVAGKLNMFLGAVAPDTTGEYVLTTTQQTDTAGPSGKYIAFDSYLKVDAPTVIFMTNQSKVSVPAPTEGTDKGTKRPDYAARVAFIKEGNVPNDGNVVDAARALMGGTKAIIWEPNCTSHTATGIANGMTTYKMASVSDAAAIAYKGVVSEFADNKLNELGDTDKFAAVTPAYTTTEALAAAEFDKPFAKLEAGVTKIRTYMWIEGQDIDCENNASGINVQFDLQFSTEPSNADADKTATPAL